MIEKANVILVKGNHDTILGPIAKKKNVEIKDYVIIDNICILHGHKIFNICFDKYIKTIIIAHEHPAITLSKEGKSEKYKCWLVGKWYNKKLIVMPSFMPFPVGSNITTDKLSPFLKDSIKNFEVYVIGDRIYYFGKLKDIK